MRTIGRGTFLNFSVGGESHHLDANGEQQERKLFFYARQ